MKITIAQQASNHHTAMVTACCWNPQNELYTTSDDMTICKWSMNGELSGKVCSVDVCVTGMHWFKAVGANPADSFVICCTDGTFRVLNRSGREEKKVMASEVGSIIAVQGNHDGQSLVTAGEDGCVKVWSRSGNLRSSLAAADCPVYSVCWGPDNDCVLFSSGNELNIQSLQVGKKKMRWKAHDGVVMKTDWNSINGLIVSGGEDCTYKVWDAYGRQLYQSQPFAHVVTSVSWCPNGKNFAVGAYNMVRLCDKTGWSCCRDRPNSGSLMDMGWTSDGTLLGGAGGNGAVVFGQIVERTLQWNNIEICLVEPNKIQVQDVFSETMEELDFRDRVLEISLGFGNLIVATATQCFIYNTANWNTPHIFDMRDSINSIIQSATHFLTIDNIKGVQVYSYEGRAKGNPRHPGIKPEHLNEKTVSLSADTIAILDKSDSKDGHKTIRFFDTENGRAAGKAITHSLEIEHLAVSQFSRGADRKVVFIDRNRDLFISPVNEPSPYKLQTQVDAMAWNDEADVLMAIADQKQWFWYYPAAVFVDQDLLKLSTEIRDGSQFGKMPEILNFFGAKAQVRRADGAVLSSQVTPYPALLYEFVSQAKWEEAVRLCRFVKNGAIWAALAAMALSGRHLETAEIALAAIKEVDKLQYVLYIQSIPSEEGRNAELLLYRRRIDDAEMTLLQANPPLVYRAIKMNIRLFRWERALELAISNKTHVDTVLGYRQRYLEGFKREESIPRFMQYSEQVKIDWEDISAKKAQEKEEEAERGMSG